MGELIEVAGAAPNPFFLPAVLGVIGFGCFALLSGGAGNDDDDSSPGGGLMQPVA